MPRPFRPPWPCGPSPTSSSPRTRWGRRLAQRSVDGRSVVGVDITLQELSRHLARSRVTRSARIALVDRLGLVVALPEADRLVRTDPSGDPALVRLDDLGDPILGRSSPRPFRRRGASRSGSRTGPGSAPAAPSRRAPGSRWSCSWPPLATSWSPARGLARAAAPHRPRRARTDPRPRVARRRPALAAARIARRVGGGIGRGDLDTALPRIQNPREVGP